MNMKMTKNDLFENNSDQYEKWFEKYPLVYQSELAIVKTYLPEHGNGLEIGAGSGRFAIPLGIETGVDPSPQMRKIAKKRGLKVINGIAENLPFADDTFDFALMVTSICFVDDLDASFREAYRILKPNGRLIIGFVDKSSDIGRQYQQHKNESVFYKSAKFYSTDEVMLHLKKAGFSAFQLGQTIFNQLKDVKDIQPVKKGYGDGSFVVISALTRNSHKLLLRKEIRVTKE